MTFLQKLKLCFRILSNTKYHLIEYAKREQYDSKGYKVFGDDVMELITVLAPHQHNTSSIQDVVKTFSHLVNCIPLEPLTGNDDEWEPLTYEISDKLATHRNIRLSSVLKTCDGSVYNTKNEIIHN